MSYCNSEHVPIYKITYKPNVTSDSPLEWLVCENCFGKEDFFGSSNEIESIVSLKKSLEIRLHIEKLAKQTSTMTSKIRKNLQENSVLPS